MSTVVDKSRFMSATLILLAAAWAALTAQPAHASLGSDVASVRADMAHMRGNTRIVQANGYAVHEIQSPAGPTLREYVSSDGKVFGVAWQGSTQPDLRQVLGSHFNTYVQAVQRRTARGVRRIEAGGLVVEFGGHQRSFFGRAYLRDMVPTNVHPESIK